jgi:transposase
MRQREVIAGLGAAFGAAVWPLRVVARAERTRRIGVLMSWAAGDPESLVRVAPFRAELQGLAAATKNANQSRRLLSLAGVLDGMNRTEAVRIGGMDRQTLRDWVHRFNDHGPEGLLDSWSKGPAPRLSAEQRTEIGQFVETGPDRAVHGVVRWRRMFRVRSSISVRPCMPMSAPVQVHSLIAVVGIGFCSKSSA